ncbi:hypothetical protein FP435_08095 [Lactobacillus sp. PV037]|uniref:hypothetical protein n=1 Tax=Lactobacillus sp. PV037 TaxID=2594496 RepID=UPI0022400825|nr:hypothetical protein [Lactobacillus sp. PV037]QNQ84380.1 hypothetical protein FP435_08095 [Lactobacillus sp. PV037]
MAKIKRTFIIFALFSLILGTIFGFLIFFTRASDDLPYLFIHQHGLSTYYQTFFLLLIAWEIFYFKKIRSLIIIRKMKSLFLYQLCLSIGANLILFILGLFLPFIFTGTFSFKYGNPIYGSLIILLHFIILAILTWCLILLYNSKYPVIWLLLILFINIFYHQTLETNYLIIHYSKYFDPLWRAMHNVYI